MEAAVIVAGVLGEAAAWRLVVGGRSVWRVMTVVLPAMGAAAAVVRPPVASLDVPVATAAAAGLAAGTLLFAATRAFVAVVGSWSAFRRDTQRKYEEAAEVPLPAALLLAVGLMVVGEELFWRGLVQARLSEALGRLGGAALTWAAFIGANLPSVSLPIVAGAVVGGAVWAGLAVWTGGMLASLTAHAVWTAFMIALPPVSRPTGEGIHR